MNQDAIEIRPLGGGDLPEADRIFRLAFGTFIGLPDPRSFAGDSDLVRGRWHAEPGAALGAFIGDELVGSNFATNWGSFGFFGPLTVRPDLWDRGIARRLLAASMELFDAWGTRQVGLFTFAQSTKHVGLYQRFGFWPQQLTAVMAKHPSPGHREEEACYSQLAPQRRADCLDACDAIADALLPGLSLRREIEAVERLSLGETLLLGEGDDCPGFAICHAGAGTEAGSDTCFVKFAAVRPGPDAGRDFGRLLDACEAYAAGRGLAHLKAGVNTARHPAYRAMLDRGFRTVIQGVAMQRHNAEGYNRPDCFVIDDWR